VGNAPRGHRRGRPALPWWIVFLVLTIAGERLELSRFLPPRRSRAGSPPCWLEPWSWRAAGSARPARGWIRSGGALLGLALWLGKQDIARRTVKERGLTGFIGACLLSGYAWLAFGAVMLFANGVAPDACALGRGTARDPDRLASRWCSGTRPSSSRRCCGSRFPGIDVPITCAGAAACRCCCCVAGDLAQPLPLRAHGGAA
jgi:hypothetical protein